MMAVRHLLLSFVLLLTAHTAHAVLKPLLSKRARVGDYTEGGSSGSSSVPQGDDATANPPGVPEPPPFRKVLADLFLSNKNSAQDIHTLAHSAFRGGAAEANRVAKAGAWGTNPKNLARDIMREMLRGVTMPAIFWWDIPLWNEDTMSQHVVKFPFLLPHEILHHMVSKMDFSVFQLSQENFPDQHRELVAHCLKLGLDLGRAIAIGVHGDGVPFQKKDSIEVVSWNLLSQPTANRIPFTAVQKSALCRCGCSGRCTWTAILRVFCWSLMMLFVGQVASTAPDGSPWVDGRKGPGILPSGFRLCFRALLMQFRGDWPFLRTLFYFPAWNQATICWLCKCGPRGSDAPFTDAGASARWRQRRYAINEFIASLAAAGVVLCPLLSLPSFSLLCVVLDWLHVVDLGVGADVVGCFFWELLITPGLLAGNNKDERLHTLWTRLQAFYDRVKPPCRLDNLTETMIRKDAKTKPKLNVKGGECRHIVPFAAELSKEFGTRNVHCATVANLFHCLFQLAVLISVEPYDKPSAEELSRRFCVLYCVLAEEALAQGKDKLWQPKPKLHLLQEMVEYQSQLWGSPRNFWCYRDESWCGFWARVAHKRGGAANAAATAERMLDRYRAKENDAFD